MKRTYPAVLGGIGSDQVDVVFPDFLGCVSVGDSIEEALENAREALSLHVSSMAEDGDPIPPAGNEDELQQMVKDFEDEGYRTMVAAITVDIPDGRQEELHVQLPAYVTKAMDIWVKEHGQTRDRLLAHAAMDYIARFGRAI